MLELIEIYKGFEICKDCYKQIWIPIKDGLLFHHNIEDAKKWIDYVSKS